MSREYYTYILASRPYGTLYIGVTRDLKRRVWQHKHKEVAGFTEKYGVDMLVYYEIFSEPEGAIAREKQLKNLVRRKKIALIEKENKVWKDLYDDIVS